MQEKELKTTMKQRIGIIIITILLLGSTITTYLAIVFAGSKSNSSSEDDPEVAALQEEYTEKQEEFNAVSSQISTQYIDTLKKYKANVKAYNAENANNEGLKTTDLEVGSGRELAEGDNEYFSYYIGWCPDESIFDSSFDDKDNPTSLKMPISAKVGLIEGWNQGVIGMKIGGVREITIPGELAYGEQQEICGTTNSPLKFIVIAIEDEKLSKLNDELQAIYQKLVAAYSKNSSSDSSSSDAGATSVDASDDSAKE